MNDIKSVDAHGLSCPEPAILARKALDAGQFPVEVLVNSVTSRENVRRAAENAGCKVAVAQVGDEFKLRITK